MFTTHLKKNIYSLVSTELSSSTEDQDFSVLNTSFIKRNDKEHQIEQPRKRRLLVRCMYKMERLELVSTNTINIISILEGDVDDLIGDLSNTYCLPTIVSHHHDLKCISAQTLSHLIVGEYLSEVDDYQVIDCRYPFEYNRGHIYGATSVWNCDMLHEKFLYSLRCHMSKRPLSCHIIIFHCEFSSKLGPKMCLGCLHGLAVACWTTDHYHPCSNSGWAYLKVVSSLTLPHYLWRSLGLFSLPCAQKWP